LAKRKLRDTLTNRGVKGRLGTIPEDSKSWRSVSSEDSIENVDEGVDSNIRSDVIQRIKARKASRLLASANSGIKAQELKQYNFDD
jgi:hypothetical protein